MGFPMAKNLLKSGYNLKAYNRSQDKADRLKEFGAEISLSIKEVVTNVDVVITMLTDDAAVEKVMGSDEFISNIKEGATVIDMSSVNPVITKKYAEFLKEKNINFKAIKTSGDINQNIKLSEIGGKNLFCKEIEEKLISNEINQSDAKTDAPKTVSC